jgi:hypothetical protein
VQRRHVFAPGVPPATLTASTSPRPVVPCRTTRTGVWAWCSRGAAFPLGESAGKWWQVTCLSVHLRVTNSDPAGGGRYRLVLRGELGDCSGRLFEGMQMDRVAGTTVLTGSVIDQVHLRGVIQRTQELGLELISIQQVSIQPRTRPSRS